MSSEARHLCYVVETLVWMGSGRNWTADMIAEQIGEFDDAHVLRDLDEAVQLGLVARSESGCCLTDTGWALAELR